VAYSITIEPAAMREIKKLDPRVRQDIADAISALAEDPRPPAAIKLKGSTNSYRARVGDHRILYRISDRELLVLVIRVGNRRDVYHR
jgi:mRNA interferase RelE/StbE